MDRNYEKELGLTQQRLSESTAKEVMYTAMIDDLTVENEALNKKIEDLESQLNN